MKLWPVAEDILQFCQNRHFRAQQEVGQGALPDGGLNCWYSASVHFPLPPACSRFQNKIRQLSAFNSTLWHRPPSLHMRLWAFSVFGELGRTYTSQELHKRSMSCWHRTSNLWPSGRASWAKQPPQLPPWLSNLVYSHLSHICDLCGQEERAWTPLPQNTPTLCPCSIQHVWPHVGRTTEQHFSGRFLMLRWYYPVRCCMKIEIFALYLTGLCRWLMIISQPANLKHHVYVLCGPGMNYSFFFPVKWKWSDHHAGQRLALCSTTFNNKATFIYYQKELMYLLLHILQLSHLLLDDQQKKKKNLFIHPATDQ